MNRNFGAKSIAEVLEIIEPVEILNATCFP
jgi:hypothetical protein